MYKYNELKVFFATQKLSYKANSKTFFSHSVMGNFDNYFVIFLIEVIWSACPGPRQRNPGTQDFE